MVDKKQKMSGAEIFFEALRREGVKFIFGYPGGSILKIYEKLYEINHVEHILVRHEQGATHAAEGYAKATGDVGVVLATSGPGATNTVTGIADAYMDSVPIVVFTGQVAAKLIGNDAFQEADIIGITRPITKHSFLVRRIEDLAPFIQKAFYIARTGRPGPVVVDLPRDVIAATGYFNYSQEIDIRGYKPTYECHYNQIKKSAEMIGKSKRPLLYVGGGIIHSNATEELYHFAKEFQIPVTMTLQGLTAFPNDDNLSVGMLGMHGTYYANQAVNNCDLIIALGARFDDRATGKFESFASNAYKIHVDIDPSAIEKNVLVDLPVVGDVKNYLTRIVKEIKQKPDTKNWLDQIAKWKEECPLKYDMSDGNLRTQFIIERISDYVKGNAVIIPDVGQHQMWTAQFFKFKYPRTLITSGGLGTMGFSIPASVGASFGIKDKPIISISGDGGFQMNMQELITARANNLPIKFFIMNNCFLGMVRQWQELFYQERYCATDLCQSNPDFVKLGEALGIQSFRIEKPEEVDTILEKVFNINTGPTLVECKVLREELVFPMVPAGGSLNDMIFERLNPKKDGVI